MNREGNPEKDRKKVKVRHGVVLKPGREKSVLSRHHWIFSGAIQSYPENFVNGGIYPVYSAAGQLLGHGYFNQKCSLAGRLLSFGQEDPELALRRNLQQAVQLRQRLYRQAEAVRLVNGESDHLPGLVVDRYGPGLVIQLSTLGMEKLKDRILDLLKETLKPSYIYEKSLIPSRKEEGLSEFEGLLLGKLEEPVTVEENGLKFNIYLTESQKTGFFLDQREMRQLVRSLAGGLKVLDGFCYTGGFAVAALKGGARRVDLVDYSKRALETAGANLRLNGFSGDSFSLINQDMFKFLEEAKSFDYGLIILDPPAFARKKADEKQAVRAYRELNRLAMSRMEPGSFLLTFSCSYYVDSQTFQKTIFQAALEAGREARIIQRHRQALDHPVSIFHPESDYLKGLLLYIS
ncbi:MAG: LSU m5C1962 methyltransferase RlmI [Candidatus Saccharicenans subterraneus]|uniref:LSU m5C1962 methyltransferase RlmI n=1 Tax=Candidatus Saccharicenans subterraneus TaxID=2508984 RepID=A0A3E2BNA6_9BACT|nr:MAG: LSU m5C1962 methyltransferase RlmI [Candidatus Saccharicenans subterraneum]